MDDRGGKELEKIVMYTDGGCHNTGDRKGIGSYAFLFQSLATDEYVDVYCEFIQDTTNNRMEMVAVIEGIKYMLDNHRTEKIEIVSDSGYLVKGFTDESYLEKWIANGWRKSDGKPVLNVDLWEELKKISWHTGVNFIHIRGHNKDKDRDKAFWNDICDRACTYMMNEMPNPGFFLTLRYYFKAKKFEQIGIKIVDNEDGRKE